MYYLPDETVDQVFRPMKAAVKLDDPMSPEDVEASWRDEFLTNVMVPYLQHIKEKYREMESEFLTAVSQSGVPATPEEVRSFQNLLTAVNNLTGTIHVLREWRG